MLTSTTQMPVWVKSWQMLSLGQCLPGALPLASRLLFFQWLWARRALIPVALHLGFSGTKRWQHPERVRASVKVAQHITWSCIGQGAVGAKAGCGQTASKVLPSKQQPDVEGTKGRLVPAAGPQGAQPDHASALLGLTSA